MNGPRHFKYITEEIVKNGCIEIHSTAEDMDKISQVNFYNQYMKECRQKMKDLHNMRNCYLLINICLMLIIMYDKYAPMMLEAQDASVYVKFVINIIIVVTYLVVNFIFCLWKGELDFWPNVLTTIALLFIDKFYWFQLAFNIVYCGVYRYKKGSLGMEPGYPLFYDIRIDRVRGKVYGTKVNPPVYPEIEKEQEMPEETNEGL